MQLHAYYCQTFSSFVLQFTMTFYNPNDKRPYIYLGGPVYAINCQTMNSNNRVVMERVVKNWVLEGALNNA